MSQQGSEARFEAIRLASSRAPRKIERPKNSEGQDQPVTEYYGVNTFDLTAMEGLLSRGDLDRLRSTIETGKPLDSDISDAVAKAAREWAIKNGATHFCHWFQPMTGSTAEKHDAFLSFDVNKRPLEKFSGSQLIQSEPDASSFPSGGMRTTFEARGYTAWDPSSPMFIMEGLNNKTLCIPSAFISYHGDALDKKTALLRSMEVLSKKACELLAVIGDTGAKRVVSTTGAEQEYFLIDRAFYSLRPDLIMSGRTLFGAAPARGQQLEDHYFGSIPARAQAFMAEFETELYKLGVPVKTRHNEVAPSQFESAPIFEDANVSTDHNQLVMDLLRKIARRHNYQVLLHEKPFDGLNGNGKHLNWSMAIAGSESKGNGDNLLDPGKTPFQNLRFLLFLSAVLKGVQKHAGLLRAAIASPGNDHRLGANEAPPAIISVFLGDTLSRILDQLESGAAQSDNTEQAVLKLGVSRLPSVSKDNTDRNRTSPFAFTGNKFEFRAVGSSMSTALPTTMLNAAVSWALGELATKIQTKVKGKTTREAAILEVLRETVKETKSVRFEGNNYSDEWVKDAEKRGLPHLRKTPEALDQLQTPEAKKLLSDLGILSEAELKSRFNIRTERYVKALEIEARTMISMTDSQILPAVYSYYGDLVEGMRHAKKVDAPMPQGETVNRLAKLIHSLQVRKTELEKCLAKADSVTDESKRARVYSKDISEAMSELRIVGDELEEVVGDTYWPLPKYREMLFIY